MNPTSLLLFADAATHAAAGNSPAPNPVMQFVPLIFIFVLSLSFLLLLVSGVTLIAEQRLQLVIGILQGRLSGRRCGGIVGSGIR